MADKNKKTRSRRVDFKSYKPIKDRKFVPEYMEQLQDSLIARGLEEPQRLAILSNVLHESGGNPEAEGPGKFKGIAQWGADRYPNTEDLGEQIKYLLDTSSNPTSPHWSDGGKGIPKINTLQAGYDSFWNSENPYDATLYYSKGYVRPKEEAARINRGNEAANMAKNLKKYGGRLANKYALAGLLNKWSGDSVSSTSKAGALGLTSGGMGLATGIGQTASGLTGLLAGGNSTGVGNTMQTIGGLASNIPGVGGLIGAGVGVAGGLINAAFGSNINEESVANIKSNIRQVAGFNSAAQDFDTLSSDIKNAATINAFGQGDVGSDGWFSDKAKNLYKDLRRQAEAAERKQQEGIANAVENVTENTLNRLEQGFFAYGGPFNMNYTGLMSPFGNQFKDGGIYIKPSKRGTFTAAAKKRGIGVQEFASKVLTNKDNYSSAMIKKANFAKNASKWKHADGGVLFNDFTNGITMINTGDTHENNPLEGVQVGVDPQGIPNLVEEGEIIFNDYVFSNRLKVPKAVRQKYKLRGVTFADAAKEAQRESEERPNDPISKQGLETIMGVLMLEQEQIRANKEANKYAKGGRLANKFEDGGSNVKPIQDNLLRYTPIIGSGLAVAGDLLGLNEPNYAEADRLERAIDNAYNPIGYRPIGNYLTYNPFDTDYALNKLNAQAAASRRAITNNSGGNRAAAMAGILASDYNTGNQIGDLLVKANEYNLSQRQKVEDFNRATNMYNSTESTKADMFNAEMRAKQAAMYPALATMRRGIYDANRAEKSANLTNFLTNIGNLGREMYDTDKLRWMADRRALQYDPKGNYTGITDNTKKCGGRIKRKKKGVTI